MKAAEISQRFKIRCSSIYRIMGGSVGLTIAQEKEFTLLAARKKDPEQKDLTEKMEDRLAELIYLDKNPELPQGAKTYCLEWIKQQPEFFNRRKNVENKYMTKGNEVEDAALQFVAEQMGYSMLIKNETREENDYMTGECDNKQPDHTIDTKASWDSSTFPLFETELDPIYEWQGRGYMELYNVPKHVVVYCLMDTPAELISGEVKSQSYKRGLSEDETIDLYEELFKSMTYEDVDPALKLKALWIERDKSKIEEIKFRVELCREFIMNTIKNLKL